MTTTDTIYRTISQHGAFRLVTAVTTTTARGIVAAQQPRSTQTASLMGQLATAAILVREMMDTDRRVQMTLKDPARGSIFADTHPGGLTRGLVQVRTERPPDLGAQTLLQVIRVLANQELQQGLVDTAHDHGLAASLSNYMSTSEQVTTVTDLATVVTDDGAVTRSAGYMLQLLPDADTTELTAVTAQVESLGRLDDLVREMDELTAEKLTDVVFGQLSYRELGRSTAHFGCNCSRDRVIAALGTMGRDEVVDAIESGEVLAIDCDYCSSHYDIDPSDVLKLYDA